MIDLRLAAMKYAAKASYWLGRKGRVYACRVSACVGKGEGTAETIAGKRRGGSDVAWIDDPRSLMIRARAAEASGYHVVDVGATRRDDHVGSRW